MKAKSMKNLMVQISALAVTYTYTHHHLEKNFLDNTNIQYIMLGQYHKIHHFMKWWKNFTRMSRIRNTLFGDFFLWKHRPQWRKSMLECKIGIGILAWVYLTIVLYSSFHLQDNSTTGHFFTPFISDPV